MSNRIVYFIIGTISLIIGGSFYVIFRENSYISHFFSEIYFIREARNYLSHPCFTAISWYLPDFLWAFSLCCGLFSIFEESIKTALFISAIVLLYSMLWEFLQYIRTVEGTADILDIVTYLFAILTALLIYYIRRKEK